MPGAERIEINVLPPSSRPRPATASSSRTRTADAGPFQYERCSITRPANDETFVNVSSVSSAWEVRPSLRPGDAVRVALNGKLITDLSSAATGTTFDPIPRGAHNLTLMVQDLGGQTLCQSSITFHVRQASLLAPTRTPGANTPNAPTAPSAPGVPRAPGG